MIEFDELDVLLNILETSALEPHDEYKMEFTNKEQRLIHEYIKTLQQENKQLKEKYRVRSKAYNNVVLENANLHEVIDEARKEIKNIQEHYHELIMKDYKQEDSVFVNKCCKTGFILNVKSYFDLIELILNKYKGDNNG